MVVILGLCPFHTFINEWWNICGQNYPLPHMRWHCPEMTPNRLWAQTRDHFVYVRPANGRWRYNVMSSLIGQAHTQNDPCKTAVTSSMMKPTSHWQDEIWHFLRSALDTGQTLVMATSGQIGPGSRAGASTTRVLVLYKMINMNILKTLYSSTTRVLIFQYSYSYVQYSPQPCRADILTPLMLNSFWETWKNTYFHLLYRRRGSI